MKANISHGFLIVEPYANLYRKYVGRYNLTADFYALPRTDRTPEQSPIQYRGLDRDALSAFKDSKLLAEIRMAELEDEGRCDDDFLFTVSDLMEVIGLLPNHADYEVIWTKHADVDVSPPEGFVSVGFDPTYFGGDHFSASCDCMLIPRWHGSDKDGTLFLEYFRKLNSCGLFRDATAARVFLDFYLSFDWTETGDYSVAEVFLRETTVPTAGGLQ